MNQKEEKEYKEMLRDIQYKIDDVIKREGKIKRITTFGNSHVITFENGRVYQQKLISLANFSASTLD